MEKLVERSIRITEDEARALADLAAEFGTSESAILEQLARSSLREARIRRAVAAYERDQIDLRDAAVMAGIPIGALVDELAERCIPLLRDPEMIEQEIADLLATFGPGREQPDTASVSIRHSSTS